MVMKYKPKCESKDMTTIRNSTESHLHWKKRVHKNPLCFRIYADFEADNEIVKFSVGNKTTDIYKQNPILNGYHKESKLEDVFKSGYYKYPLGYNNVDWFVDEVRQLENKIAFFLKNTNKDITMTKKDEEDYSNIINCRFCEKNIKSDEVTDHCHLTGNYRGPAQNKCNINVIQKKNKKVLSRF